ncbi:MAG: prolyl oligopeptidase family serine peptidase [Oligoflexales bacterium]|nr:prolyl oligopeptidase family serine peptidase [Oligoflexales bacterium]
MKLIYLFCLLICMSLPPEANKAYGLCLEQAQQGVESIRVELAARSYPSWDAWQSIEKTKSFEHISGSLSVDGPGQIPFDFYLSNPQNSYGKNDPQPLIVLFPGFGGASWIDHYVSKYFAKRGFHVAISHYRDEENDRKPEKIYEVTKNNMLAGMSIIDAFSELPEVDTDRIGLLGYSFGGIRGGFLSIVDERMKAANFVVSSAQFARTIIDSSLPAIKDLKEEHMRALGSPTEAEYESYIESSLPFEPYQAHCSSDYSNHFLITAKADTIVPTPLQESYASQLPGAQTTSYQLGHIPSVLWFAMRDLSKSEQFFKSRFESFK